MIKNNSDIGVFSISTIIFKDSNKDETFFQHSLFHLDFKLLQSIYIQCRFL